MTMGAAPESAMKRAHAVTPRSAGRPVRTISGCCQAILTHFALRPETIHGLETGRTLRGGLRIGEISHAADHLAMTLFLPMPYGDAHMMVSTIDSPCIMLPGLSLSPVIAASAIGQPIGRLTGHPAFAELDHLVVASVEAGQDEHGRSATMLHFADPAEPLLRTRPNRASRSIH